MSDSDSLSDWESIRDEDNDRDITSVPRGSDKQNEVVLEVPSEVLINSADEVREEVEAEKDSSIFVSATHSSSSSFVSVSRFDHPSIQSKELSTASSHNYKSSTSEDSSVLSNFEILSLSSGVVRQCKRCKFHNTHDAVVCASCELALVANPNVSIDAQIAVHLQQKEEADALARLQESELKLSQLRGDPLYEAARILVDDVKRSCASFEVTMPSNKEDLERLYLNFIKQAKDFPEPKSASFAFKCTPHLSLESIQTRGLPADQHLGMAAPKVEVSHSLTEALASFNACFGMTYGNPLCPIPENGLSDTLSPSCLCWVVAVVQSMVENPSDGHPNAYLLDQTLPIAYFDSSRTDIDFTVLLYTLRITFQDFFVASLGLPITVNQELGTNHCPSCYLEPPQEMSGSRQPDSGQGESQVSKCSLSKEPVEPPAKKIKQQGCHNWNGPPHSSSKRSGISTAVAASASPLEPLPINLDLECTRGEEIVDALASSQSEEPTPGEIHLLAVYPDDMETPVDDAFSPSSSPAQLFPTQMFPTKPASDERMELEHVKHEAEISGDLRSSFDGTASLNSAFSPMHRQSIQTKVVASGLSHATPQENALLAAEKLCNYIRADNESREDGRSPGDGHKMSLKMKSRITALEVFETTIVVCCNDKVIHLWEERTGRYEIHNRSRDTVSCLTSAPSAVGGAYLLASGDAGGGIVVYELHMSRSKTETTAKVTSIFAGRDHRCGDDYKFLKGTSAILDLRFLPKGTALAAVNSFRQCRLFSLKNNSCLCKFVGKGKRPEPERFGGALIAQFSLDGNILASAIGGSQYINLWKLTEEPDDMQLLSGHEPSLDVIGRQEYLIRALCFSPDGNYMASAGNDCTIRLWEIKKEHSPCARIIRVPVALTSLSFSPESSLIAGGSCKGKVHIWNLSTVDNEAEAERTFVCNAGSIKSVRFLPDGKTLISVGWSDCDIQFWALE